ncbi:class I adenylate-forming enzyme family protein [Aquabacterium sp. CECT 9606]|uniref:class I adenylate-forming enzyme family protein n=1 Tax=Aquabacterium sp. CECT 9606 TaxID=2845822 RepID=UPI001E29BE2F|nr:AMP-binding protein [Aquabacterium sp. CECT 9606]CAH0351100.1 Long-chain-fatty-acid--CoA ligase [Aquabacterium sp. CECT 9606]
MSTAPTQTRPPYIQLTALPHDRMASQPHARCLADEVTALDNAAFHQRVVKRAEALSELGVSAHHVVAIMLPNDIDFVVTLFAAWQLDAAVTPVNPASTELELNHQLEDSGARVLVCMGDAGALSLRERHTDRQLHEDDLALLIYTSGTTGRPKGVMLSHGNLQAMVCAGAEALEMSEADRSLLILPLFHVNAVVVSTLVPLCVGGSVVIADKFSPTTFFDKVQAYQPTYFSGVPTIFAMLLARADQDASWTRSLRLALCGAAPAQPGTLAGFQDRFGVPILEGYGLSEATCASTLNPLSGVQKPGTVGLPLPGQEVRVVLASGQTAPVGEVGEVQIKGPTVMRGYLGRPEETAKTLVDGWLKTGDLGHLDADGYLALVGRSKEMIIRGGENVYPKEVEDALCHHPSVSAAAVIGLPDLLWGERVVAAVEVVHALTPEELMDFSANSLAPYKRPVEIRVMPALPRTAVGKVNKPQLKLWWLEA